jgi:hypothetical protein
MHLQQNLNIKQNTNEALLQKFNINYDIMGRNFGKNLTNIIYKNIKESNGYKKTKKYAYY